MLSFFKKKEPIYSDAELVERYKNTADLQYLGVLFDRYIELAYGTCLKYLKEREQAEDAVMEVFELLTKKVLQHKIENFRPWLYVFVKNHCLQKIRKEKKSPLRKISEQEFMQSAEKMHPEDEGLDFLKEKEAFLVDCLEKLSDEQKECIQLFYYQGYSYKEIAEQKKLAVGKIRSYIQNGRRNLKLCIEKKNG